MTRGMEDPERSLERRVEVARQSGVPVEPLRQWAEQRRDSNPGIAAVVEPHRELLPGTEVETDHGAWSVYERRAMLRRTWCCSRASRGCC